MIPEKAQETLNEGVVLAVGPGALNQEGKRVVMSLKEGDKVILPAFGGNAVKLTGGEEMLLFRYVSPPKECAHSISEVEILAKLEK